MPHCLLLATATLVWGMGQLWDSATLTLGQIGPLPPRAGAGFP